MLLSLCQSNRLANKHWLSQFAFRSLPLSTARYKYQRFFLSHPRQTDKAGFKKLHREQSQASAFAINNTSEWFKVQ